MLGDPGLPACGIERFCSFTREQNEPDALGERRHDLPGSDNQLGANYFDPTWDNGEEADDEDSDFK